MKKIIGITSILATLVAPSVFAAGAVDGGCREADRINLEDALGYGASGALATVQERQQFSLTESWAAAPKDLNNVHVYVGSETPAQTKAQFIISTANGVFISPQINRDSDYRDGNHYCFELGNSLSTTPRNEILDVSVQFMKTEGESVRIRGLGYKGINEHLVGYTVMDYLEPSFDYPKTLNFDIQNGYNDYMLYAAAPLFSFGINLTLICDDGSTHYLTPDLLENSIGLKLNIGGLCTANSQLEITSSMMSANEYWLLGK